MTSITRYETSHMDVMYSNFGFQIRSMISLTPPMQQFIHLPEEVKILPVRERQCILGFPIHVNSFFFFSSSSIIISIATIEVS